MARQEIFAPGEAIPDRDAESTALAQLDAIAHVMDSSFTLPGTNITIGLDALLGLLPVLGDTLSAAVSAYIVKEAHRMGAPVHLKARMGANIFVDWLIGLVPVAGDLFDIGWKANRRNVALLRAYLASRKE